MRWWLPLLLLLAGCAARDDGRTEIVVQRFFGECGALHGASTDVAAADTECGIVTTLLNRFQAENPDVRVSVNIVAWPGYPTLAAQVAAREPPDVVTMHQSVISDYQARGLLEPMDAVLARAGISAGQFTAAARRGVTKDGRLFALPFDTVGRLWHVNTRLMARAGLMRGGRPVLPRSPAELLDHARRFKAATGLPYLIQAQVNAPDALVANYYTYVLAQGVQPFPAARRARLDTPEARAVVDLFRRLNAEGLTTRNADFPAATAAFVNGEGGIFPTGTWMLGPYDGESRTPGRPLHAAYAVAPFPALFGPPTPFVDGHAWVMPRRARTPQQVEAIVRLMCFLAANNGQWARTGHIPAMAAVLETPAFRALPHRADLAPVAATGVQLPGYVQRQSAVQGLIGEELESAVNGAEPTGKALSDAERRVNELFAQML